MTQSLRRRLAQRAQSEARTSALRVSQGQMRTGQVSRSTILLGDEEVFLDDMLAIAASTTQTVEYQDEELTDSRDISDDVVDVLPDMTEDSWDAVDVAQIAFTNAETANENIDVAQAAVEEVAIEASLALETSLGNARYRQVDDGEITPAPPEGGFRVGAELVRIRQDGRPYQLDVWNGTAWVRNQILADSLLIYGEDGTVSISNAEVVAPRVVGGEFLGNKFTGGSFYGGYMEAPTIASSAGLGGGDNRLNDPQFESAADTAWVASGHLGDSATTQVDTITWDQSWTWRYNNGGSVFNYRNQGRMTNDFRILPRERHTGTLTFPNFSWINLSNRSISNPYTFRNLTGTSIDGQLAGNFDPTHRAVNFPPMKTPTTRTTYLTNSAVVAIVSGETWHVRLRAAAVEARYAQFITAANVQIINASNNSVIKTIPLSRDQLMAGFISEMWTSTFTGNVKYRIMVSYTAGGAGSWSRVPSPSSWANQTEDGVTKAWTVGQTSVRSAPFGAFPTENANVVYYEGNNQGYDYMSRMFTWFAREASFSKVGSGKGWRLSEGAGLELFNELGARTGKFDGEDNYFAGLLASAESGTRWEIARDTMSLYGPNNLVQNTIGRNGSGLRITGPVEFQGDTAWGRLDSIIPGASLGPGVVHGVNSLYVGLQARVKAGVLYLAGRVERSGGIPANHVVFSLPAAFRSPIPDPTYVYSGADNFVVLQPNGDCILALAAPSYATITKMTIPLP